MSLRTEAAGQGPPKRWTLRLCALTSEVGEAVGREAIEVGRERRRYSPRMPPRILIAKPGLDGHDRGAKVVARALRDAGCEVIYSGLHQTPSQIVETAIQEDDDGIGLSGLSGAHLTLFPRVVELLEERDAGDIVVFGGGIIPDDDIAELKEAGLAEIFTPGTPLTTISAWVDKNLRDD